MVKIRNRVVPLISLVLMLVFVRIIQHSPLHVRTNWELNWDLFWVGLVVITVALTVGATWTPALTATCYLFGFFAGALFHQNGTDPGGATTNNFWQIWVVVYLGGVLLGIGLDIAFAILRAARKLDKTPPVDISSAQN